MTSNPKIGWRHITGIFALLHSLILSVASAQVSTPQDFLNYCLDNPDQCALSINHITQGWERDFYADRLQSTASIYKILILIAYADAVTKGHLDPAEMVSREEWARYWVGRDGGALHASWNRLGDQITIDDMVSAMIQESDNTSADWLLNKLGSDALQQVIEQYIYGHGYHDLPVSVNTLFITHDGNPDEPDIGNRVATQYSGFKSAGYQNELADWFVQLQDPLFVAQVQDTTCWFLPWDMTDHSGCIPDFRTTSENLQALNGRFFMRSNARTYTDLMTGLLNFTLLEPEVASIVRRHLEFRLSKPNFEAVFTRHGGKGGSLTPNDIRNWTVYMESRTTGDKGVVTILTQNLPSNIADELDRSDMLASFAEEVILNPHFAITVMNSLPVTYYQTEWLDFDSYQQEFNELSNRMYPLRVEGRLNGQTEQFRALFAPFPVEPFWFYSYHGQTAEQYREIKTELEQAGFIEINLQMFNGQDGGNKYQTTWISYDGVTGDTTAPMLTMVTPIPSVTRDDTPEITFNTDEAGTIAYAGDCASATITATAGDNTITFNQLTRTTHTNCTLTVTDAAGNQSASLSVSDFSVTLQSDLNLDRSVNVLDFGILKANYGTTNAAGDVNFDGIVNVLDFGILKGEYGSSI